LSFLILLETGKVFLDLTDGTELEAALVNIGSNSMGRALRRQIHWSGQQSTVFVSV
jgi:hypothetical protein